MYVRLLGVSMQFNAGKLNDHEVKLFLVSKLQSIVPVCLKRSSKNFSPHNKMKLQTASWMTHSFIPDRNICSIAKMSHTHKNNINHLIYMGLNEQLVQDHFLPLGHSIWTIKGNQVCAKQTRNKY